jgi:hypothetical protein
MGGVANSPLVEQDALGTRGDGWWPIAWRKMRGNDTTEPCLFLSHSGADSEAARELKRRILETPEANRTPWEVHSNSSSENVCTRIIMRLESTI